MTIAYVDKGGFWKRQILFRDYLRKHPKALHEYADLKADLLKSNSTEHDGYIAGKS